MTRDLPIACSLSAEELPKRLGQIEAIGRDSLLAMSPDGELRFRADEATRARLEEIIAAESECCSFLGFDLREDEGELVLRISAPAGAESLALELANAFAAPAGPLAVDMR